MNSTITNTGMPMTTSRQPSLVIQLITVNGSFNNLITILRDSVASPSN